MGFSLSEHIQIPRELKVEKLGLQYKKPLDFVIPLVSLKFRLWWEQTRKGGQMGDSCINFNMKKNRYKSNGLTRVKKMHAAGIRKCKAIL